MARAFSAEIFVSCFLPDMFKFVTDSVRVKRVISTKEFVLPFECGANTNLHLEGEDQRTLFVLTKLIGEQ